MQSSICKHGKRFTALLLVCVLVLSLFSTTAFAAQENGYHDPAEHWLTANNRTNELDANAVVTHETFYCAVCQQYTSFMAWRTPEYTRDGATAMTRNVKYSDGTLIGGSGTGSILDGTPGVDAYYTGYHWTKACCETCGTMNSNMGITDYGFDKNVYWLYDCAAEFMETLDETVTYEYADSTYHTKTTEGGTYCCFCYGTNHTTTSVLERHTLNTEIIPQISNGRFAIVEYCNDCGYTKTSYVAAKSVVADYYGVVDGQPHTLTVSDLSESGVITQIRYGNSAEGCTLTSAPSYTEQGQYTVYYEITYSYNNTTMTENGVAYVWLYDESAVGDCPCGCGDPDCGCQSSNCSGNCCNNSTCGTTHNYKYLDTVSPTCLTLGYDRYLCPDCGSIEKRNYTNALGHAWQSILIREADCETQGKVLNICSRCGAVEVTYTDKGEHEYSTYKVAATCTSSGYTVKECEICGERIITDITDSLAHNYVAHVTTATCTTGGQTLYRCDSCGSSFVSDHQNALGHSWNDGEVISDATCTTDGIRQYTCTRCGETELETIPATGHTMSEGATCLNPGVCVACGAVLDKATGHDFKTETTEATCLTLGYTTYTCVNCGYSYKSDYVNSLGHDYVAVVTEPACTEGGYTTHTCSRCGDSFVNRYTSALGHSWDDGEAIAEASCTSEGVMQYTCERCGEKRLEKIPATGHTLGEGATCLNPGTCAVCGAVLEKATGHNFIAVVTPSTCLKSGYTTFTCENCGFSYKSDYTDPLGHDYVGEVTEPTCTEGGYTVYTCSHCGDSYVDDYTDALGHDWDEGRIVADSVCVGDGVMEYWCQRCDYHRLDAISAKGHTPGAEATCTTAQLCTVCGAVLAEPTGHGYESETTDPTCVDLGYTTYTCSACGDSYKADYVNATGHTESDWIIDKEPTTSSEGSKHKECVDCGEVLETATIDKIYLFSYTDNYGEAIVGNYLVTVTETASGNPIHNASVALQEDGSLIIVLPDGRVVDYANQTTVTVQLQENKTPVSNLAVLVTDEYENIAPGVTDENGTLTIPGASGVTNSDGRITIGGTDKNGNPVTLTVKVEDFESSRPIPNATIEVKSGVLTVVLPDGTDMDEGNRILVTVLDNTKQPVSALDVTVKNDLGNSQQGKTNKDGKLIVPALSKAYTDGDGIAIVGQYTVIVMDSSEKPVANALVTLTEGKDGAKDSFSILLPDGRLLNADDQTTVTVLLPDASAAVGLNVKVEDGNGNHAAKDTDKAGQVVVPDKTGNAGETIGKESEASDESNTINVDVTDEGGRPIDGADIAIGDDGNVSVKLPDDFTFADDGKVTVSVTDNKGEAKEGVSVTVTDGADVVAEGETDKYGKLTVPVPVEVIYHSSYIVGYSDGTFGPSRSMTRAEAATIFARLLAAKNGDTIYDNVHCSFSDVSGKAWYAGYVKYLETFGIIEGYEDGTFRPEQEITRAEFVVISVRFYEAYGIEVTKEAEQLVFTDVSANYWASEYITEAAENGWVVGYGNGTFAPDNDISRAEVVTIVNRVLNREADEEYVDSNLSTLRTFSDMGKNHWAYYAVMEAANAHDAVINDTEIWSE